MSSEKPHISFNQLKSWSYCPRFHKLDKLDKASTFKGNIFSVFGHAAHKTAEFLFSDENFKKPSEIEVLPGIFEVSFRDGLSALISEGYSLEEFASKRKQDTETVFDNFLGSGKVIAENLLPALKERFGNFEVLGIEEKVQSPILGYENYDFLGYIDLIIKTEDEKIHILDYKTCSWGWNARKKSDKITTYQLTLYKYFWMLNHGIQDHKLVDTHFTLLKRDAKKDFVEVFKVPCGDKKMKNAVDLLQQVAYNLSKQRYFRNRQSCFETTGEEVCPFYWTYCNRK